MVQSAVLRNEMPQNEHAEGIRDRVKEAISKVIPQTEIDIDETKEEIWKDLSELYYKYEDGEHKRAFREILQEISEKIGEGKWDTVYKKIYREEQKEKPF